MTILIKLSKKYLINVVNKSILLELEIIQVDKEKDICLFLFIACNMKIKSTNEKFYTMRDGIIQDGNFYV